MTGPSIPVLCCNACGDMVRETHRYEDGAVAFSCPCRLTLGFFGVEGELDLGIIPKEGP